MSVNTTYLISLRVSTHPKDRLHSHRLEQYTKLEVVSVLLKTTPLSEHLVESKRGRKLGPRGFSQWPIWAAIYSAVYGQNVPGDGGPGSTGVKMTFL